LPEAFGHALPDPVRRSAESLAWDFAGARVSKLLGHHVSHSAKLTDYYRGVIRARFKGANRS